MKYLAVIPARGGSKGIPGKNIYPLLGKPMMAYVLEAILKTDCGCDLAVSSDSEEILAAAARYDGVFCIRRPDEISGDTAGVEAALLHALQYMKDKYGKNYDAVLTVQANSPLCRPETLTGLIKRFEELAGEYDAIMTVTETKSDFWLVRDGSFERLFKNAPRRRQDRESLFIENSAAYLTKTDILVKTGLVLGTKIAPYNISEEEGLDIHDMDDIGLAEYYLQKRVKTE